MWMNSLQRRDRPGREGLAYGAKTACPSCRRTGGDNIQEGKSGYGFHLYRIRYFCDFRHLFDIVDTDNVGSLHDRDYDRCRSTLQTFRCRRVIKDLTYERFSGGPYKNRPAQAGKFGKVMQYLQIMVECLSKPYTRVYYCFFLLY